MTLLAGCYERFLFGYKYSGTDEVSGDECTAAAPAFMATASATAACRQCRRCLLLVASAWQQLSRPEPPQLRVTHRLQAEDGAAPGLQRSLTHAAHKGAVKCAAAVGQFAATGGADDLIHLYDLRVRQAGEEGKQGCPV
jgi:hypothetical protein